MIPGAHITIGIPCYNEAVTVGEVVRSFQHICPGARVLVLDNASTDETARLARDAGAEVVAVPRRGKGHAVRALFSLATTEFLVMVDGDLTYPAAELPLLLAAAESEPTADMVVGTRSGPPDAFVASHQWANRLLAGVIGRVFGSEVGDLFSGYRVFRRRFYRNVPLIAEQFQVEPELCLQALDKGFHQVHVPVRFQARPAGSHSKLRTWQHGAQVLTTLLRTIKDFHPLAFFTSLAAALALLSLAAGAAPVWDYVQHRYVYRVPLAILATGLGVLSVLALVCGLILDTIARQHRETFLLRLRQAVPSART